MSGVFYLVAEVQNPTSQRHVNRLRNIGRPLKFNVSAFANFPVVNSLSRPADMPTILIADDFEGLAETLAELIEDEIDCATACALDGQAAVDFALHAHPEVGILDIDMPRLTGIEAARIILDSRPDAPPLLIAMTGGAKVSEVEGSGHFNAVFGKPWTHAQCVKQ